MFVRLARMTCGTRRRAVYSPRSEPSLARRSSSSANSVHRRLISRLTRVSSALACCLLTELKVVQEGLQDLVQDLIRSLDSYTEGLRTLPRQIQAASGGGSGLAGSSYFSPVPLPDWSAKMSKRPEGMSKRPEGSPGP